MLFAWCEWLQHTSVGITVAESLWLFPTLECIHIYSMIFLITSIAAVDLRLLGFAIRQQTPPPVSQLLRRVLRWVWVCLAVNAVTGSLLFAARAEDYYNNSAFQIKILLIVLGVVYHSVVLPRAARLDEARARPIGIKFAGGFSLVLWVGVIAASRWIGFV